MKELIIRHKRTLILSSILILLPIVFGLIMWDRLPDPMPTHFDANGVPNGYSSKPFAVFGIPLFLLAMEWVCLLATGADPKRRNINPKMLNLVLWVVPAVTLVAEGATYSIALGVDINITRLLYPVLALVFIVIGNYLPKCRQSYTMGIKVPWTLADEDNWNKTHRMAGPLWMLCGVAMLVCTFLPGSAAMVVMVAAVFCAGVIPMIYSYLLAKKNGQV